MDNKKKTNIQDNGVEENPDVGNILYDYEHIAESLWLKNLYFQECFYTAFGKELTKIIFSVITKGYLSREEYNQLIDACGDNEIKLLMQEIDIELINSGQESGLKLSKQNLIDIGDEIQIEVDQLILKYRIFDDILDNTRYGEDYESVSKGEGFEIVLHKETEIFYLKTGSSMYVKHHVFGDIEKQEVTVSHLMFEGDSQTHIYDFDKKRLQTFQGEYIFAYNAFGVDYVLMEDPVKGSILYGIQNGIKFQKIANVLQVLEHGDDVLVIYTYAEISNSKVGKNKTRRDSYVGIYSLSEDETIHEFDGANIELEGIIQCPEGFALNLHEKNLTTTLQGTTMNESSSLYYFDDSSKSSSMIDPRAKLRFGKNTTFDVHISRNDIIIISHHKINLAPGKNTDFTISHIHSLSGELNITNVREIVSVINTQGTLEVHYIDTRGKKGYFNSDYSYLLTDTQQPSTLKQHLN